MATNVRKHGFTGTGMLEQVEYPSSLLTPISETRAPKWKWNSFGDDSISPRTLLAACSRENRNGQSKCRRSRKSQGKRVRILSKPNHAPPCRSNLFQFTFILNRELVCNRPLFIRFLDTFVSFHLRHGTSLLSSIQWPIQSVQSSVHRRTFALLNFWTGATGVQALSRSVLFKLESTVDVRYPCIQKHCNFLAPTFAPSNTFETPSTIFQAFIENNVQVIKN